MHVSRSIPSCRRSGCLTRSARRATPVATAGCGTTSARCATGADRVGGSVRDAGGASGPGGLRDLHPALGPPARPCGLSHWLRPPADDGRPPARVRAVRRCPEGAGQMRAVVLSDQRVGGGELVLNAESALPRTGDSTRARAGRIGRRRRARWSGQSATSVTASSTGVRSRTTRTSTSRRRAGWRARPTCVGTVRRASAQWTASSGTSVRCCVPWHASLPASRRPPRCRAGPPARASRWSAARCGSAEAAGRRRPRVTGATGCGRCWRT